MRRKIINKIIFLIFGTLLLSVSMQAQRSTPLSSLKIGTSKKVVFRPTKDQIMRAQKMLRTLETGKMDSELRTEIKKYQSANELKVTGPLNRETLGKMGIKLTGKQLQSRKLMKEKWIYSREASRKA